MNIPDHISEGAETIFYVKILKFFDADADPGIFLTLDPGSGMGKIRIRDKHPGSATQLISTVTHDTYRLLACMAGNRQILFLEVEAYGTGQTVVPYRLCCW